MAWVEGCGSGAGSHWRKVSGPPAPRVQRACCGSTDEGEGQSTSKPMHGRSDNFNFVLRTPYQPGLPGHKGLIWASLDSQQPGKDWAGHVGLVGLADLGESGELVVYTRRQGAGRGRFEIWGLSTRIHRPGENGALDPGLSPQQARICCRRPSEACESGRVPGSRVQRYLMFVHLIGTQVPR